MIKTIIREPFFHFLVLGILLYAYYDFTADDADISDKKIVSISPYEIAQIKTNFKKMWHTQINDIELETLIQQRYHESILLDEALTLGLEKSDSIIVKRLIEKMQHLLVNETVLEEPTEDELEIYYKNNLDAYSRVNTVSFSHIYFQNLTEEQEKEMKTLLNNALIESKNAHFYGDVFEGKQHILNLDRSTCKEKFGNYFTLQLFKQMPLKWHGPIRSKMGIHFVYIDKKETSEPYSFDEVQSRVYTDYLDERKIKSYQEAYKKISTQYELKRE
ncbi:MAG: peptidylprolyl isomerase [Campylobacterota bacterium]|nr:peptidylprolyl isomerase [Campylobacterota bacterium]